jgi:phage terminase small subunit
MAKRFALEYARDFRARAAAVRAGASPRSAHSTACEWLKDPDVQRLIEQELEHRRERNEVLVSRTMREYSRVAFSTLGEVVEQGEDGSVRAKRLAEMQPEEVAAVREIRTGKDGEVEVKLHDKVRALDSLAKVLGLFRDEEEAKKVELIHRFVAVGAKEE